MVVAGYRRPVLVFVRHGQTEANARGLLLGRADPPLSELGRRQAAALAARVPATARVVASPLTRVLTQSEEQNGHATDERHTPLVP